MSECTYYAKSRLGEKEVVMTKDKRFGGELGEALYFPGDC